MSTQEAIWLDEEGFRIDDPQLAVRGIIIETMPDGTQTRTYMDRSAHGDDDTPFIGAGAAGDEPWNGGDLLKAGTWDLRNPDHSLVSSLDDLLLALHVLGSERDVQEEAVRALMVLPSWQPAPESLKARVRLWLRP